MGGSGGGGFYSKRRDPIDYGQKLRQAEEVSKDKEFESEVSKLFGELLAKYNDRDVESINKHLDTIKQKLGNEIKGALDLVFNGSVAVSFPKKVTIQN